MSAPLARPRDYLLLAALGGCWGSNFLAIKLGLVDFGPATLTLGRLAIGAAILLIVMKAKKLTWPRDGRRWAGVALVALLGNAVPYTLIAWGEVHITSQLAAILIAATPLMTLPLAHLVTRDEKLNARRTLGVALGFAGVLVLVGLDALGGLGADLWAQLALLAAALSYAVCTLVARRLPETPPVTSALLTTAIATLYLFPLAAAGEMDAGATAPGWVASLAVIWLGAVSTAGAMLLYFTLIRAVGATFVSLANYMVPLIALGLGGVLLGEEPSWNGLAALALILLGVFLTGGRSRA